LAFDIYGILPADLANIRLDWQENTQTYYNAELITALKSLKVLSPVVTLFSSMILWHKKLERLT
jgi:hypothetical protein